MSTNAGFVLVVDDDPLNLDVLSDVLQDAGFAVTPAASGRNAMELLNERKFDLVLLDIKMPVSGLEVLQAIREQYGAIRLPVIMVTGEDQSENIVKALSLGANDYVTKPVDFPVLQARIMAQLARRAEVQQKAVELQRAKQDLEHQLQKAAGIESRRLSWSTLWITSAKGGAGKTTLAVNLAIALAEDGHGPVALLDLGSGETGVMMGLQPKRSLSELFPHLTQSGDEILHDSQTMGECAAEHVSGVTLFTAYQRSDYSHNEGIAATAVRAIIARLTNEYNCLVVDSPSLRIGDDLQVLSAADVILILVGNSTVLELRETKAMLEAFNTELSDTRAEIVICSTSGGVANEMEMERRLDTIVYASFPKEDKVVNSSINLGNPVMVSAPESRIARSIRELARKLAGDSAASELREAKERKKVWSLFGSR